MTQEPPPLLENRLPAPTVRSRLMLEVASELVARPDWLRRQVHIGFRDQGPGAFDVDLFASDGPDAVADVLSGACTFGIINPATALVPALTRLGASAADLAAIATVPSYDQLGLAVPESFGVSRLEDLAAAEPAVVLSLRGQRNHSVHMVVEDVLAAVGIELPDFERWGGTIRFDHGIPHRGARAEAIRNGTITAVFDEGIYNWVDLALDAGLTFLTISPATLARLESSGYRRSVLTARRFPRLASDIATLDFSGFLVYCRSDADADLVRAFCEALEARSDRIAWQGGARLPLRHMVSDAVDAPLPVPLHPVAAEVWADRVKPCPEDEA